jgi:hypothetical protein
MTITTLHERELGSCVTGDSILFEGEGLIYTLLEELIKEPSHSTWNVMVTAHEDERMLGSQLWFCFSLTELTFSGGVIIRGS